MVSRKKKSSTKSPVPRKVTRRSSRSSANSEIEQEEKSQTQNSQSSSSPSSSSIFGFEKEINLLRTLISSALNGVESNTVLVVGARGAGKTALVNHCLAIEDVTTKCDLIHIDGFLETDDSSAVKLICSKLDSKSTSNNLTELLSQTELKDETKRPKIIILDEFDVFCFKNQNLLYCLFESTRRCKHLLVIAMTTRMDALELLEKRVKSRMNQIVIQVSNPFSDFDEYFKFSEELLATKFNVKAIAKDDWIQGLKQLYSRTCSIRELEKHIVHHLFLDSLPQELKQEQPRDLAIDTLRSLSNLELSILVMLSKHCRDRRIDNFNTAIVFKVSSLLPSQMVTDRAMIYKVINNLSHLGLISPIGNSILNEWTRFTLNVSDQVVKKGLKVIENSIPSNLKNLLSF